MIKILMIKKYCSCKKFFSMLNNLNKNDQMSQLFLIIFLPLLKSFASWSFNVVLFVFSRTWHIFRTSKLQHQSYRPQHSKDHVDLKFQVQLNKHASLLPSTGDYNNELCFVSGMKITVVINSINNLLQSFCLPFCCWYPFQIWIIFMPWKSRFITLLTTWSIDTKILPVANQNLVNRSIGWGSWTAIAY